jgi:alpha-N-arabinofuranosidase
MAMGLISICLIFSTALHGQVMVQPAATINVNLQKEVAKVSPTLYGLMTEEINHSYDGGLYAELVRNRTFHKGWDEPAHWFLVQYGAAKASMQLDPTTGPRGSQERRLLGHPGSRKHHLQRIVLCEGGQ